MFDPKPTSPEVLLEILIESTLPRWDHPEDEPDFYEAWDYWTGKLEREGLLEKLYSRWETLIKCPQFGEPLKSLLMCTDAYADALDEYDNVSGEIREWFDTEMEERRLQKLAGAAW